MSKVIEKESGKRLELNWKGLSLSETAINGLIGFDDAKARKLNNRDDGDTGIFVMSFKNRIISVYYDISCKKVGVWDAKEDKS